MLDMGTALTIDQPKLIGQRRQAEVGIVRAEQQTMFGTVALPLYAIVRPDGSAIASFPGLTRDASAFLAFLQRAN